MSSSGISRVFAIMALLSLLLSACTSAATSEQPQVPQAKASQAKELPKTAQNAADQWSQKQQTLAQEVSAYPDARLDMDTYTGPMGTRFTMTGTRYPANQEVVISWLTFDGRWQLEQQEVVLVGPRYDAKTIELARVKTDATGTLKYTHTAPEDFGGVHDIYTRIDGKFATKTAFTITPTFSVTPTSGPIGTPVTITATGLGYKEQLSLWQVAWDYGYTGYMTAVQTRGTATGNIRMAGPPGPHSLKLWRNYRGIPYLNPHQGPFGALPPSTFTINVTEGVYKAPAIWEHPKAIETVRPTPQPVTKGGASLKVSQDKGPVGTKITLQGAGFPANKPVKLTWSTRMGQDIRATGILAGFKEDIKDLIEVTAGSDGTFTQVLTVFDDYAGEHRITAQSGDKLAETYFSIYAFVSEFTEKVRAGDPVKVRLRGVGWTIQGKTYAVVIDNRYLGYICSFSSKGYIELDLPPFVKPGVYLIDLYPAIYEGDDAAPNIYSSPNLTYLTDHPGSTLSAFRLTLTVTE